MNVLNHPLVQSLAQHKIKFTVDSAFDDPQPVIIIEGFSKSGTVMLYLEGEKLKCLARYNEVNQIDDFDDLVAVAYDWWYRYRERLPFESPHIMWLPHFLSRGWVKEQTTISYKAAR